MNRYDYEVSGKCTGCQKVCYLNDYDLCQNCTYNMDTPCRRSRCKRCKAWYDLDSYGHCKYCAQQYQESSKDDCSAKKVDPTAPLLESRLYILMRTDMLSMNPGKAMAQATHAGQLFQHDWGDADAVKTFNGPRGFGTTIVLGHPNGGRMIEQIETMNNMNDGNGTEGYFADVVLDPTYPLKDGNANHQVPMVTCAYVFVNAGYEVPEFIRDLQLHP